jgi:hypothetical protein
MRNSFNYMRSSLTFKLLGLALLMAPRNEKIVLAAAIQRFAASI